MGWVHAQKSHDPSQTTAATSHGDSDGYSKHAACQAYLRGIIE